MKKDIHPQYHSNTKVRCACGNEWTTGSTLKEIAIEVCSKCHPFYTGKDKKVDIRGRIDKFTRRQKKSELKAKGIKPKKPRKKKN